MRRYSMGSVDEAINGYKDEVKQSFTKFDEDKPRVSLVEPQFILGISKVLTFGAKKYGPNNWKEAQREDRERVKDAILRHLLAYLGGEKIDPESGYLHLYHIGCNTMFLDYFDRESTTSSEECTVNTKCKPSIHKTKDPYDIVASLGVLPSIVEDMKKERLYDE